MVNSNNPNRRVWSFITDGMQQDHCYLPHRGGAKEFSKRLPQHIQGVLAHGFGLFTFRTYHNYNTSANLTIHALSQALKARISAANGELPDVVVKTSQKVSSHFVNGLFVKVL